MLQFQGKGLTAVMFALVRGLNHLMQQHQGRKDTLQSYGFGLLFLVLLVISSSTLLLQEKELTLS